MNTDTKTQTLAPVRALRAIRTPYHVLGGAAGTPHVPEWAQHRSVYRAAGRTLYRVGTDKLDATAQRDLNTLAAGGWNVEVDRDGEAANITMNLRAA